ncbi:hypothetical protein [Bradyrhizobium roseum]|uniref:hypothetical protein n=1 Tax=Bradyrhizobium roseum TaxID=3056648 RepID=UPI002602EA2C|nr:hypothetical protein [Bradyrhizobium roseus]WKA31619.1 hypothetical protein QUH67_16295 [Bradyrhizobium roseus]
MKTEIIVLRGALRGRAGWISGSLEDRARRGITKAIVHAGDKVELLSTKNLQANMQQSLFPIDGQAQ